MAPSKLTEISFTTFTNIVDGQPRNSKEKYHGVDPTTREANWDVPVASAEDVDDAVAAANRAFKEWKKTTWEYRNERIARYQELFHGYHDEMTALLKKETGKPAMFAANEVQTTDAFFDWHKNMKEPTLESFEDDKVKIINKYVPLGVVGAICPWNFPIVLSLAKILPAIQMGNAVIVKPSPFTPYTALKLVEIAQQIFPPGLVQALGGNDKLGPMLTDHPDIHKISFTGSTATGKRVMAACAKTVKRVTLEMGGNDPCIVLPHANIAKTAPLVAMGSFFNSGQVCVDSKRVYVHSSIYRPFVDALVNFAKTLKVGNSDDEGVMLGPVQNEMQYEKVKGFFQDSKGLTFALGSANVAESKGFFIQPTIIDNPPDTARIVQEEPFGPIVPCQSYDNIEDVIARANRSRQGLGACVFGSDIAECEKVAAQIESGSVWINNLPTPAPMAQFGGFKESGLGTEFGTEGVKTYANIQAIHTFK